MASITLRDPFGVSGNFRQAMKRFSEDPLLRSPFSLLSEEGILALDISEDQEEIIVTADLPGFKKEEIDVQIHDGILSIRAQRSEEHEGKSDDYYRRERSWGSVSRRVALPGVVKDAAAEATLKDGVLTLRIPVPEQSGPK
ncbi:MAG: Hsp20/alpha crystallin family protein [Dehalococcoidia bacterium]|nr:Hsp20/alpha crystallin family protein [Dehalococcoidia bacterium]